MTIKAELDLAMEIACACDLLNTWARECGVEECRHPYANLELRNLVDRIWNKVSVEAANRRTVVEAAVALAEVRHGDGHAFRRRRL